MAFTLTMGAYLTLPAGAAGARELLVPAPAERPDTMAILIRLRVGERELRRADSSLVATRGLLQVADTATPMAPTLNPDSLTRAAATLSGLLQRVTNAPLPASYRALGESPMLRGERGVGALLDSLIDAQREREAVAGGGVINPAYVALTARANEIGRSIEAIAVRRLASVRAELAAARANEDATRLDTMPAVRARDAAQTKVTQDQAALVRARATSAAADRAAQREQEPSGLAGLPVMIASALILSVFMAFSVALLDEMRSPRVADVAEAERLTSLRVLAAVGARSIPADRRRREADRSIAALLDPTSDSYRILAWHLTSRWPAEGVVTIVGDEPLVAAVVGANLAAVFAVDARATLLVDAEFTTGPVQRVLELPDSPGLAAVLENRRKWSEALLPVGVGRSRSMDVLPAGERRRPLGPAESQALVNDLLRAARRHDATVVVSSSADALRRRAGDDVVICARLGATRLATLARGVASLSDAGARIRGIVLWEGTMPKAAAPTAVA